jgi:Glycosyl hydrolase family 1
MPQPATQAPNPATTVHTDAAPAANSVPSAGSVSGQAENQQASQPCDPFLIGTAISVYQNSGGPGTNWSTFEARTGKSPIQGGDKVGTGADFWGKYEEDIQRAVELNSNCFRLSLEWGRIEPAQGQIDREGIERYHQIIDCLHRCKLSRHPS